MTDRALVLRTVPLTDGCQGFEGWVLTHAEFMAGFRKALETKQVPWDIKHIVRWHSMYHDAPPAERQICLTCDGPPIARKAPPGRYVIISGDRAIVSVTAQCCACAERVTVGETLDRMLHGLGLALKPEVEA